jgi:hypothetical protein
MTWLLLLFAIPAFGGGAPVLSVTDGASRLEARVSDGGYAVSYFRDGQLVSRSEIAEARFRVLETSLLRFVYEREARAHADCGAAIPPMKIDLPRIHESASVCPGDERARQAVLGLIHPFSHP